MIQENVNLVPFTYYKIGGPARYFVQPQSIEELKEVAAFIKKKHLSYFVLGAGSNVLFDDSGFDGCVIQTGKLDRTLVQHGTSLEVGASVLVIHLLRHCMANGIAGFELLVGIPGNMGGVMNMNAGTKLGEIKDVVTEITAFDLASEAVRVIEKKDLKYSYRHQHFLGANEIILRGKFEGKLSDPKPVQDAVQNLLTSRKKSQPIDKPSCGSVFKNPDSKNQAWQLIDKAGLRGYRQGNAQISEMHTNFIVNLGGAQSSDVKKLIAEAKKRVQDQFGIALEEEVQMVRGKKLN